MASMTEALVSEDRTASYGSLATSDPDPVVTGVVHGKAMSFHNVEYSVSSVITKKTKSILNGISGILPEGLNAIMGPTGSGKTSLLDILAGRKDPKGLKGDVLVNGERQPKNFKCIAGYVSQDDVLMGTLSVRENFHFSASLRLPASTTRKQRAQRVKTVIRELGLQYCADTKIGTEFFRGVSGGERKRTNIGMELIIEPKVLFLDEPTTGLDANTAVSVAEKLKILSKDRECTIVMVIHQPRYSIFKLFDTLTLLSQGSIVYHGQASEALEYFKNNLGFPIEEHENPADFFLDVTSRCENASAVSFDSVSFRDKEDSGVKINVDMKYSYRQSEQYRETQDKISAIMDNLVAQEKNVGWTVSKPVSYSTGMFWQLLIVCIRAFRNLLRAPMSSVMQVVTMIIFALLAGLMYFRLDNKDFNAYTVISNWSGALFFVVISQTFSALSAIDLFIKERAIFMHENLSGFYRASAFFVAKVIADLLPMRLIPLILYVGITYFLVGFQREASKVFIFYLTLGMTSIATSSMAFAVSSRISDSAAATLCASIFTVFSMLFAGFLVSLKSLPGWLRWMKYLSFFRYTIEALSINEMADQCYFDGTNITGSSCSDYLNATNFTKCELPLCVNGTEDLVERGYETEHKWIWYDQIGLVSITIVLLAITYINLRTIKKLK